MAQNPELEPAQEQFGPQLSQEQWTPENYDNSPHLVYKTGHSFYGDPGLFHWDPATVNTAVTMGMALLIILGIHAIVSGLGPLIAIFKNALSSKVEKARSIMSDPKMIDLANMVLTSIDKYYKQNLNQGDQQRKQNS